MAKRKTTSIRDRVIEMRHVRGRDLVPDPRNWRRHPPAQTAALRGVLDDVGFAGAILARIDADGRIVILDGHARAAMLPDQELPVLVTDLTEQEAAEVLATYDPIGAMATPDETALAALLDAVQTENAAVRAVLEALSSGETRALDFVDSPDGVTERRENDNMAIIGTGQNVGLQWGDLMVALPRDLYERIWHVVNDARWPSRAEGIAAILTAGVEICSESD